MDSTVWTTVFSEPDGHEVEASVRVFANLDALAKGLRIQLRDLHSSHRDAYPGWEPRYDVETADVDDLIEMAELVAWDMSGPQLIVQETTIES